MLSAHALVKTGADILFHYLNVNLLAIDFLVKFWWELSLPQQFLIDWCRHQM